MFNLFEFLKMCDLKWMRKVLALKRLTDSNIGENTFWTFACISLLGHKIQMHEKIPEYVYSLETILKQDTWNEYTK